MQSASEQMTREIPVAEMHQDTAEDAFGADNEEGMREMKRSASFHKMSSTAEERKRILKNDSMNMTQEQKEQYIKEYQEYQRKQAEEEARQREEERQREERRREIEQQKEEARQRNEWGFEARCLDLAHDNEEASESFQAVKINVLSYFQMSGGPIENPVEYIGKFQNAKMALNAYLSSHRKHPWSSKGKRRRRLVTRLLELLTERESMEVERIREAWDKKTESEEKTREYLSDEKVKAHMKAISDYMKVSPLETFDKDKYMNIAAKGTMKEKIRALYEIGDLFSRITLNTKEIELTRATIHLDEIKVVEQALTDSIQNASKMEQMEADDILSSLDVIRNEEIVAAYRKFREEAPEGENADAYAAVRLKNEYAIEQGTRLYVSQNLAVGDLEFFIKSGKYMEAHPEQEEMNQGNGILNQDIETYMRQLKSETIIDMDFSKRFEHMDKILKMGNLFQKPSGDPLEEEDVNNVLSNHRVTGRKLKLDAFYGKLESVPENESEEQREARREKETTWMQKLVGHDGVDYQAYEMAANYYNMERRYNNTTSSVQWSQRVRKSKQKFDPRIPHIFMKGYKSKGSEDLTPLNAEEEDKMKYDEKFVNDYLKGSLEDRKVYLDQYINELLNIQITEEMFRPEYMIKHFSEMFRTGELMALIQNIWRDDKINKEYFKTLPVTVQERINLLHDMVVPEVIEGIFSSYGIHVPGDKFFSKYQMESNMEALGAYLEVAGESMPKMKEISEHPMDLEEERRKQWNIKVPENATEEEKAAVREKQTKMAQHLAGHQSVDYRSYNIAVQKHNYIESIRKYSKMTDWDKKAQIYKSQHDAKGNLFETRMHWLFFKLDDGTGTEEEKLAYNQKFTEDYLSEDFEKRKPYLNDYLNQLMNIRITKEMLEPEYIEKNYMKVSHIARLQLYFQNIIQQDIENKAYLESLPESVQQRVKDVMSAITPFCMGFKIKTQALGISGNGNQEFAVEDEIKGKSDLFGEFAKEMEEQKTFETMERLTSTPMTIEEELKKVNQ